MCSKVTVILVSNVFIFRLRLGRGLIVFVQLAKNVLSVPAKKDILIMYLREV